MGVKDKSLGLLGETVFFLFFLKDFTFHFVLH